MTASVVGPPRRVSSRTLPSAGPLHHPALPRWCRQKEPGRWAQGDRNAPTRVSLGRPSGPRPAQPILKGAEDAGPRAARFLGRGPGVGRMGDTSPRAAGVDLGPTAAIHVQVRPGPSRESMAFLAETRNLRRSRV